MLDPECAAYDVADAPYLAAPVDTAGYNPVIPHQTGSMMLSYECHPGTQCVYGDGDGDGASGGVGVAADTLSTAISAEAVASSATIDIAAPVDGVDGAAVIGALLYDQTHHHCCFWVHMEHLMMITRYALRVTVLGAYPASAYDADGSYECRKGC